MRDCGSEQKPILCSSLTSESQMRFLGIWRPIIQMMLVCHCSKNSLDIHKTLRKMLKNASDEIHDIILHLFNMPDIKTSGPLKLPMIKDPIQFVKREKYPEDIVDQVLEFIIDFMREVLGEKSEEDLSEDLTKSVQSKNQN